MEPDDVGPSRIPSLLGKLSSKSRQARGGTGMESVAAILARCVGRDRVATGAVGRSAVHSARVVVVAPGALDGRADDDREAGHAGTSAAVQDDHGLFSESD